MGEWALGFVAEEAGEAGERFLVSRRVEMTARVCQWVGGLVGS